MAGVSREAGCNLRFDPDRSRRRWPTPDGLRGYSHEMPDTLRLRPMTDTEFGLFRARAVRDYAADQVKAGEWPPERSEELAEAQTDQLLPEGTRTPGMLLLMAETKQDGPVGYAWLALAGPEVAGAWIYDIAIDEEQRGKGYGRALLNGLEQAALEHGCSSIGLNVFAGNDVARRLYERAGFHLTSIHMAKPLGPEA
jgi:ribosomal protein S18 acetylase RimI-like enzyme